MQRVIATIVVGFATWMGVRPAAVAAPALILPRQSSAIRASSPRAPSVHSLPSTAAAEANPLRNMRGTKSVQAARQPTTTTSTPTAKTSAANVPVASAPKAPTPKVESDLPLVPVISPRARRALEAKRAARSNEPTPATQPIDRSKKGTQRLIRLPAVDQVAPLAAPRETKSPQPPIPLYPDTGYPAP